MYKVQCNKLVLLFSAVGEIPWLRTIWPDQPRNLAYTRNSRVAFWVAFWYLGQMSITKRSKTPHATLSCMRGHVAGGQGFHDERTGAQRCGWCCLLFFVLCFSPTLFLPWPFFDIITIVLRIIERGLLWWTTRVALLWPAIGLKLEHAYPQAI